MSAAQRLGPEKAHYWLVQRMLKRTGADAVAAFEAGELTSEDWAAMLTRCRTCAAPDKCLRLLDALDDTGHDAPDYCLNRDALADLPHTTEKDV